MKERFIRFWKSEKVSMDNQNDQELAHSCAGRIINAMTFIVLIICLGLWILAFLLLKDRLFVKTLSGNVLTDLTCLIFFGGMAGAIFAGVLAGNFLRRAFWRRITRRKKV